jgi:Spy/CpxP family protein refolding chaperone
MKGHFYMLNVRLFSIGLLTATMLTMGIANTTANAEDIMDTSASVRAEAPAPVAAKKQGLFGRLGSGAKKGVMNTGKYAKDATVGTAKSVGGGVVGVGKAAGGAVGGTGRAVLGMPEAPRLGMAHRHDHHVDFHKVAMAWEKTIELTPKQKADIQALKARYIAETNPLEAKAMELKKASMMYLSAEAANQDKLNAMIDDVADAKRDLMKKRVSYHFQMEELLTPEQVTKSRAFWREHMKSPAMMSQHSPMMKHENGMHMRKEGRMMPAGMDMMDTGDVKNHDGHGEHENHDEHGDDHHE